MSKTHYVQLKNVSKYYDGRIDISKVDFNNYISTENMVADKGGIENAASLPEAKTLPAYDKGDILLSNIRPYFKKIWFADKKGGCSNDVLVLKVNKDTDAKFLYYVLSDNNFFNYSTVTSKGTKMPRGSKHAIMKYLVPDIDIPTQQRIADILSAYDDLIENNNRRIELLEKAAQDLYKEWFVRFRFPGYKTAKYEKGIPQGWEVQKIGHVADIMSGGTPKTGEAEYYGGEIPFFTPRDSNNHYFVSETLTYITPLGLKNCNSRLYPKNTTMITARGTVGKVNILSRPMAMNQSCYALKCDRIDSPYYLFFALKNEVEKLVKMASGGVFDTIIISTFNHIQMFVPDSEIVKEFNRDITPIMDESRMLQTQNQNLVKQRDMLLPRLMSGKLEV